jgi:ATP-dependent DNA helicase DinG
MATVEDYIAPAAIDAIRAAITDAQGREVFLLGHTNDDARVYKVDVVARGSAVSVAAVLELASYGDVAIHNHPSRTLEPSESDVGVASVAARAGVASFLVNNDVTDIYVLVEPMRPPELAPLDPDAIAALVAADGPLAQSLPNYEERGAQLTMLREVTDAFNHDKIAVIEAGTGTGKTLAYLVPAVAWALKNEERVVIATHTINLQEQILYKDLPLVQSVMPHDFKAVLVKGRNNYVCLRKVHAIEEEPELFADEDSTELQDLLDWALVTKTGDVAELSFVPRRRVWEKLHSSGESCFHVRCPHFRECFVWRARREASTAQILVTNHALLFADIAMRAVTGVMSDTSVLPKYRRLVLDEAHNLEEVASDHFGGHVARSSYLRTINLLFRAGRGRETGSLAVLGTLLVRCAPKMDETHDVPGLLDRLEHLVQMQLPALQFAANDCFEGVANLMSGAHGDETGTIQYRVTPERRDGELWQAVAAHLDALRKATRTFVNAATELLKETGELPAEEETLAGALMEAEGHVRRLGACADVLEQICNDTSDEFVNWVEVRVDDTYLHVSANRVPLNIAEAMITCVYEPYPTVVMTSATLTSRRQFDFFEGRLGLTAYKERLAGGAARGRARPVSELLLPTPFDFVRQVVLAIPTDIDTAFIRAGRQPASGSHDLRSAILALLRVTHGSAFVLFTSYGLLRKLAREMRPELEALEMNLLVQGTCHRDELLRRFRNESHAVLFGTDSFWAGVDVVGPALQSVIITKLPFRVPTEPVIEARTAYIDQHGGNSFREYTVPLAVIKFRQGFGRLIRSRTDYGMVAILDRRVIERYYGKWFLQSLPECTTVVEPLDEVVLRADKFLAGHRPPH